MGVYKAKKKKSVVQTAKIPRWVYHIPPLYRMYWNPVFQRCIIRSELDIGISPHASFYTGAAISVILSLLVFIEPVGKLYFVLGFEILAVLMFVLRIVGSALISSARNMHSLIVEDMKDAVLTTPLKNSSIYYGISIGTLMRGASIIEVSGAFVIGLVLGMASMWILAYPLGAYTPLMAWQPPYMWLLKLAGVSAVLFFLGIMILLIFSFASTMYATYLDVLTSVIMSLVHFTASVGFGACMIFIPFVVRDINNVQNSDIKMGLLFGGLFLVAWLGLVVLGTGWSGLMRFARARTPGYYKDSKLTAEDQVMRGL